MWLICEKDVDNNINLSILGIDMENNRSRTRLGWTGVVILSTAPVLFCEGGIDG